MDRIEIKKIKVTLSDLWENQPQGVLIYKMFKILKVITKAIIYRIHWHTIRRITDTFFPIFFSKKIKDIKTVAIILGPYRNLTTLTAAVFSLHPNCQVLEHAGSRVFNSRRINFFENYSNKKFNNFLKFAVYASLYGRRGDYGGGTFHSPAFVNYKNMRKKYYFRYPSDLKKEINCVFWKESLRVTNLIRKKDTNIDQIIQKNKKLRFVLPIRNPLDCAKSNIRLHLTNRFTTPITNIEECIEAIFKEFLFFISRKKRYPNNFFYFFEDDFANRLPDMASFLNLEKEKIWIDDASEVIVIKSRYTNSKKLKDKSIELANIYFKDYPNFKEHLIELIKK